ncbi:unnamed protein product [Acanthoscelides obtectus]|uniref:Prokaryotic-type class I peptide chain release factors domain-containing protein n=1 Tax=Acanthoscelides obtectus TaxID=200917 RepID=A0A9P0KE92_ACAOB|nr:unnamed protein product [Acanthoscelides obtectus]CAK1667510.1 Probable peptide chain release factor C12orf65 homolog, mitochondrial [Acanthoscelides obtectus]
MQLSRLVNIGTTRFICRYKHTIDYSRIPTLLEKDLEETYVRGSGPGGQKINKTSSCVVLKHLPSGIVVKNQETRFLEQNRKRARAILVKKLDNLINGEHSIEAQMKALEERKRISKEQKNDKKRKMKEMWQEREGIE